MERQVFALAMAHIQLLTIFYPAEERRVRTYRLLNKINELYKDNAILPMGAVFGLLFVALWEFSGWIAFLFLETNSRKYNIFVCCFAFLTPFTWIFNAECLPMPLFCDLKSGLFNRHMEFNQKDTPHEFESKSKKVIEQNRMIQWKTVCFLQFITSVMALWIISDDFKTSDFVAWVEWLWTAFFSITVFFSSQRQLGWAEGVTKLLHEFSKHAPGPE